MHKLATQIIDAYDDLYWDHLQKFAAERPDTNILTPDEKSKLSDDDYALTFITKEAQKLNKFPIDSYDNTWLSNKFFPETHFKLASEAQVTAAQFIKRACEHFGIEADPVVVELSKTASAKDNIVYEHACKPVAQATKLASEVKVAHEDFAEVDRICDNYTHAQYVFSTPELVKAASQYFEEKHTKMPLETRHKYAAAIQIRAEELGMPEQKGAVAKYASNAYNAKLAGHLASRRRLVDGTSHEAEFGKIASLKDSHTPYQFAQLLNAFDKKAGLNRYYGGYLTDPFQSTFAATPENRYSWMSKTSSKNLSDEDIKKVVNNRLEKIAEYFGKGVADEMKKDPVAVFNSLPNDAKEIMAHLSDGAL